MTPGALYLIGPPGCGKSTVMSAVHDRLGLVTGDWERLWPDQHGEFRGEPLHDIVTGEIRGLSLGVTRERFSGTDAIGLASHSEALRWVAGAELPSLILGEGARLGTGKFLTALGSRTQLRVAHLTASEDVLDERCVARGSNQAASYRKGCRTRARLAAEAAEAAGVEVLHLDTEALSLNEIVGALTDS